MVFFYFIFVLQHNWLFTCLPSIGFYILTSKFELLKIVFYIVTSIDDLVWRTFNIWLLKGKASGHTGDKDLTNGNYDAHYGQWTTWPISRFFPTASLTLIRLSHSNQKQATGQTPPPFSQVSSPQISPSHHYQPTTSPPGCSISDWTPHPKRGQGQLDYHQ